MLDADCLVRMGGLRPVALSPDRMREPFFRGSGTRASSGARRSGPRSRTLADACSLGYILASLSCTRCMAAAEPSGRLFGSPSLDTVGS